MRQTRKIQLGLTEDWLDLEHAKELATISRLLDDHPRICELVYQDLRAQSGGKSTPSGAQGMSAEQVLRVLLIKQMNGFSYRELEFHLADSRSYRTFCRIGMLEKSPSKSTLAANIKALKLCASSSAIGVLGFGCSPLGIEIQFVSTLIVRLCE